MSGYSPASQPPAGLAEVLNPAVENRDSAYFSSSSNNGEASKHTSQASCHNPAMFSPSNSSYPSSVADNTPSPVNQAHHPPTLTPTSANITVASLVSPTTPSSMDASMLAKLDRPTYDPTQRFSAASNGDSRSRRESVESRTNLGLGIEQMKIAATNSPYASHNQSTTSLQSSLQQQRNPGAPADRLSGSRYPNTYQPNSQRYSGSSQKHSRTAPTITGPTDSAVAHAAEPTKGQPWAFPDDADPRPTSGPGAPREPGSRQTSFIGSRRSSAADSISSSQYTTESHLPPGQRRLEEGYSVSEYNRASNEFQASHHHHTLQNKQIAGLQNEDGGSPGNSTPYSRTPELRVSHKLAERKRRNEMKELYDELRDLMPQDRGTKASKWEILSKAIAEHKKQSELIHQLTEHYNRAQEDLQISRRDTNELKQEVRQLRQEFANLAQQTSQPIPPGLMPLPAQPPTPMESYSSEPFSRALPHRSEPRPELPLPPLRSINAPLQSAPESMTGVQYQVERPPNMNGYRPGYPSHN